MTSFWKKKKHPFKPTWAWNLSSNTILKQVTYQETGHFLNKIPSGPWGRNNSGATLKTGVFFCSKFWFFESKKQPKTITVHPRIFTEWIHPRKMNGWRPYKSPMKRKEHCYIQTIMNRFYVNLRGCTKNDGLDLNVSQASNMLSSWVSSREISGVNKLHSTLCWLARKIS